jgi:hypothetical protein
MNKTGTTSLHYAFLELGLKSIHHGLPDYKTLKEHLESAHLISSQILECKKSGEKLLKYIDEYDTYSDIGPIVNNFEILDKQYPDSKFIYTDRNTDDWIKSRCAHIQRNINNTKKGLYSTTFVQVESEKWRINKERHLKRVKSYFKDRSEDLLIFNMIDKNDGYDLLCPFLGMKTVNKDFPRKNIIRSEHSKLSKEKDT